MTYFTMFLDTVEQQYQQVLNNNEKNEIMKESLLENFFRLTGIIK